MLLSRLITSFESLALPMSGSSIKYIDNKRDELKRKQDQGSLKKQVDSPADMNQVLREISRKIDMSYTDDLNFFDNIQSRKANCEQLSMLSLILLEDLGFNVTKPDAIVKPYTMFNSSCSHVALKVKGQEDLAWDLTMNREAPIPVTKYGDLFPSSFDHEYQSTKAMPYVLAMPVIDDYQQALELVDSLIKSGAKYPSRDTLFLKKLKILSEQMIYLSNTNKDTKLLSPLLEEFGLTLEKISRDSFTTQNQIQSCLAFEESIRKVLKDRNSD